MRLNNANFQLDDFHPKIVDNLILALEYLGADENTPVFYSHSGGQGVIFTLKIDKYDFPLMIKIPYYDRHPSEEIAEHGTIKEGRIAKILSDMNLKIAPTFITYEPSGLYFIREYVSGQELEDVILKSSEKERDAILLQEFELVKMVFKGFHHNNIEHCVIRDLKPRNLIYTDDKKLYFIDYGSVRPESNMVSKDKTKAIKRFGNGHFLHWPIEQLIEDKEHLDHRLDYFAWGVMAYFTLFLERPFTNSFTDVEIAKREYAKQYQVAISRLKEAQKAGRLSEFLCNNIIHSLDVNPAKREFIE